MNEFDEKPKKTGFLQRLKDGLSKTKETLSTQVEQVFSLFKSIDEDLYEELEEALIMADIGAPTSIDIVNRLREGVKREKITETEDAKQLLRQIIREILSMGDNSVDLSGTPALIMVIGVNGVGKTTTIGKLAAKYNGEGKKVLLAAADTFRAAAIDQLQIWAERTGVDVIRHNEGSDPAAVVYDAAQAAKSRGAEVLICDTAGRLHNKKNLMEELKKIYKVLDRELPDASKEVLLVLDATTGQNAVSQVAAFSETADITGIVLTKLDGTAKGGIVIAIKSQLGVPIKFVGVGEGVEDLQEFDAETFANALFD